MVISFFMSESLLLFPFPSPAVFLCFAFVFPLLPSLFLTLSLSYPQFLRVICPSGLLWCKDQLRRQRRVPTEGRVCHGRHGWERPHRDGGSQVGPQVYRTGWKHRLFWYGNKTSWQNRLIPAHRQWHTHTHTHTHSPKVRTPFWHEALMRLLSHISEKLGHS